MGSAPFGIEIHSSIESLDVLRELGEDKYVVTPPRRHPRFEMYAVHATTNLGVVWVKGISADQEADPFGFGARTLMDELISQLQRRYGPGEATDFLLPGALWADDRDWVMAIHQRERLMSHVWESGKAALPGDLESIYLGVTASGSDTAAVTLEYASSDMAKAEQELQERMSDLL